MLLHATIALAGLAIGAVIGYHYATHRFKQQILKTLTDRENGSN